jgi:hypothetical protein
VACDPSDLALSANLFQNLFPEQKQAVVTYLLALLAGGPMDPSVLALQAKDFQNLQPEARQQVDTYLLCQLTGGSGSSTGGVSGGNGPPTALTPGVLYRQFDSVPAGQIWWKDGSGNWN